MGVRVPLLSLLALVPLAAGCQKAPAAKLDEPHPVAVLVVAPTEAAATHSFTGVVRARYEADIGFRVSGKVTARSVEVGQRVAAGQTIATLDPSDYELAAKSAAAELGVAEADARNAAAELARAETAIAAGAASRSDLDARRAAADASRDRVTKATRDLELAHNRLAYCTLAADADGLVTAVPVEAGQVVSAGQTVARVARAGHREAVVSIPEHRLDLAKTGTAQVSLWSAATAAKYPVKLRELSPVADAATRTYQARFAVAADVPGVELGMTATVHLSAGSGGPTFLLPASALVRQGSQGSVWVVGDGGKLALTPVTVARYGQDEVAISGGLRGGEKVVRAGVNRLHAGLVVRTVEGK
ncbi:MAG TPA: efflux RND transporter periplasmic adaptor subunit [Urbifossiella sp.]|nr:efflux RND transporter periplasmic adaptor subunit [Urbifossiella sp.]